MDEDDRGVPTADNNEDLSSTENHGTKRRKNLEDGVTISEEKQHYNRVLDVFRNYSKLSKQKIRKSEVFVRSLPENHRILLGEYSEHLSSLRQCVDVNQKLFDLIIGKESLFENHSEAFPDVGGDLELAPALGPGEAKKREHTHLHDGIHEYHDKCQAVLKQLVRDWSKEGQKERNLCYGPILEELDRRFEHVVSKGDVRVLIPGAGLGRLTHEIVRQGFCTEGNEFSLFMLFASNFILNRCSEKDEHKIFPWVQQNNNVLFHVDQVCPVLLPDIDPSDLPRNPKFSMTAGDFLDVYSKPEHERAFDCVVTCFFIDCAKNIVAFLERIYYCLKENGVWINLGPLTYHYADMEEHDSIEPPYDILAGIIRRIGFKIEKEILDLDTAYADNRRSMVSFRYKSVFLVCSKPNSHITDSK